MKFKLAASLLAAMILASDRAWADTDDMPQGHHAMRKLGRGVANVVAGVVEVPNQYTKVNSEHGGAGAYTYGIFKGVGRWFARELIGVYEIVTFPFPMWRGYKPIMKPEFPIEDYEP